MKRKKRRLRKEEISAMLVNVCFDVLANVLFLDVSMVNILLPFWDIFFS